MNNLVQADGTIRFGFFDQPVDLINYRDYALKTHMGRRVPDLFKRILFNQFIFIGMIGPEYIVGLAVVDLKYLSNGFFYVFDRQHRTLVETSRLTPPGSGTFIDPRPDRVRAGFRQAGFSVNLEDGRINARSKRAELRGRLDLDSSHPVRICTRAGYRGWVYKQSTTPVAFEGQLTFGGKQLDLASPNYQALIDWTAGYMRRQTYWNWTATAARLPDGRILGLNLSCGVNETSFTESYFLLDGQMTKVDSVYFEFSETNPHRPWRITSFDGKVELTFKPDGKRGENVNTLLVQSKFNQFLGALDGRLITDQGETLHLSHCPAWAEDHYAKW
jgi:hypothetical protein